SAPLSSRGSPETLLSLMGLDQVLPSSVEREKSRSLAVSVHCVQPIYSFPACGPLVSATTQGLSSNGIPGVDSCDITVIASGSQVWPPSSERRMKMPLRVAPFAQ